MSPGMKLPCIEKQHHAWLSKFVICLFNESSGNFAQMDLIMRVLKHKFVYTSFNLGKSFLNYNNIYALGSKIDFEILREDILFCCLSGCLGHRYGNFSLKVQFILAFVRLGHSENSHEVKADLSLNKHRLSLSWKHLSPIP